MFMYQIFKISADHTFEDARSIFDILKANENARLDVELRIDSYKKKNLVIAIECCDDDDGYWGYMALVVNGTPTVKWDLHDDIPWGIIMHKIIDWIAYEWPVEGA